MSLLFMTEPNQIFRLNPVLFLHTMLHTANPEAPKEQDDRLPELASPLSDTVEKRRPLQPNRAIHRFKNSVCPHIKSPKL